MKNKKYFLLVMILVLLTAACSTAAEPEAAVPTPTELIETIETEVVAVDPTCQPNIPPPQPSAQDLANYTPDPASDWIIGPEDARITIVEYADFQCPYCSEASIILKDIQEKYPEDVRIVYRHFPLVSIHDKATLATQASEAAGLQGADAFWSMHDMLYETQTAWGMFTVEEFGSWLVDQAAILDLDSEQFELDLFSETIVTEAEATWIDGQEMGLQGTPSIKINGLYDAKADPQTLTAIVEMIKLEDQQFSECPPMTVDAETTYYATIETEGGDIVIELFPDVAPMAVNSFIYLAENGWFDGIMFHRVIPDFVAQTGDPSGTGYGNPGYSFSNEVSADLVFDRAGLVAMANSGPDTNGSQFFITYAATPNLNGSYTIFGEVIEGMDVVDGITPRDPQQGGDIPFGDVILNITIDEQ
ncbi:MAG: peptidylprolyl isomerase [Anaerolineales bacterium]|nr:peptidylprolyl isomerase [Anaerolineales bacterium]